MKIGDYFVSLERSLRQNDSISSLEEPLVRSTSDDHNGLLKVRVWFWDESYLDIYEAVSTELGYPVRVHYAYTYVHKGRHVFRYDNAPHYPDMVTYPHHKHVGIDESPAPADQPTLGQVLAEIEPLLGESAPDTQ